MGITSNSIGNIVGLRTLVIRLPFIIERVCLLIEHIKYQCNRLLFMTLKVRACTKIGCGLPSAAVRVETGRESPLPLLLMSTQEGASIGDVDNGDARLLATHQDVLSMTYSEEKVFYLDGRGVISVAADRGKGKVIHIIC